MKDVSSIYTTNIRLLVTILLSLEKEIQISCTLFIRLYFINDRGGDVHGGDAHAHDRGHVSETRS